MGDAAYGALGIGRSRPHQQYVRGHTDVSTRAISLGWRGREQGRDKASL